MHEVRAFGLAVTLLAACGGASPQAQAPLEPLIIPPMGSAAAAPPPPPPPPPAPPHVPTHDEFDTIMRRMIDLTLDRSGIMDRAQREEIVKAFLSNADTATAACSVYKVDDASLRCVSSAPTIEDLHKCISTTEKDDDDDDAPDP